MSTLCLDELSTAQRRALDRSEARSAVKPLLGAPSSPSLADGDHWWQQHDPGRAQLEVGSSESSASRVQRARPRHREPRRRKRARLHAALPAS
ncbi:hypothetical protein [Wenzhouxiangella marina]|uniref:hypothetical protein n=1 Tax=Wenzhouxiangella marina TaxID=1579979 RepID=UPI0012E140DD|nr:hypothetical protein [Wenzhouxiangella marina]MBB6086614.1 hypothetical protein [Wenzhouxiangella marina]